MQALLDAGAPVATIVGKAWDFQVTHALSKTLDENLKMIADTIAFLRPRTEEVMFDAEHFFDGFRRNREYALATLRAAEAAGAHWLVLCDTNGGTLPRDLVAIVQAVKTHVKAPLGIHVHNDAECAVANSLAAVGEGVRQVQGTMNGYGERCGNANLVSIIPSLVLKMGLDCIPESNLHELRDVSRFVSELANRKPWAAQPYVGDSAFAHKGGMHVSAVLKHPETYEHIAPAAVGNRPPLLLSELAGKSNILWKAREYGIDIDRDTPDSRRMLEEFYPNLRAMRLLDYKVRILDESKGTAAKTRVLITSGDGEETWGTVGVADNIIEASWQALVDSIEYKLRRDERARP